VSQEADFTGTRAARRGSGRPGRFRSASSLLGQAGVNRSSAAGMFALSNEERSADSQ
jgi:hypothetical protein